MRLSTRYLPEVLFILVATDVLFIVLHLLHVYSGYARDINYSIERDRGFSEVFQYVKEYWIVVMFAWLSIVTKEKSYLAGSLVFGFLLLDDALSLHERIGTAAVPYFQLQPMFGLRAMDFGELMAMAVLGALCLLAVGAAYYAGSQAFRKGFATVLTLLITLAAFGVLVDMAHVMVGESSPLFNLVGTIEDGGELIVMSVIAWYVLGLLVHARSLSSVVLPAKAPSPARHELVT